jgi:hypothetical protein
MESSQPSSWRSRSEKKIRHNSNLPAKGHGLARQYAESIHRDQRPHANAGGVEGGASAEADGQVRNHRVRSWTVGSRQRALRDAVLWTGRNHEIDLIEAQVSRSEA